MCTGSVSCAATSEGRPATMTPMKLFMSAAPRP